MELGDVAGPELHDVPIRIRHVDSPRVAEVVLEDVEPAPPKAFDGRAVVLLGDVHRVVDMDASAYLGGFSFGELWRAQRVEELAEGAVARADGLFRPDRAPWCAEVF